MMRHEILRALADPREIAHAELVRVEERGGQRQPGRIRDGSSSLCRLPCDRWIETFAPQRLGDRQVEAEKLAMVVGHEDILMDVDVCVRANQTRSRHDDATSPVT